jgi:hypothetical protein
MFRLVTLSAALAVVAACGQITDDRPKNINYITDAILAPTCGAAQCHSSFRQQLGDVFDTVPAARRSLVNNGLISFMPPQTAKDTYLIQSLTVGVPSRLDPVKFGTVRMPFDAPLPNDDVQLIQDWVDAGADGAQCVPEDGNICLNDAVTACRSDGNIGANVQSCVSPQTCMFGVPGSGKPGVCQ